MLVDEALPRYQFREVHSIVVRALPEQTWRAICLLTPAELPVVAALLGLRALPARLVGRAPPALDGTRPLLEGLRQAGFVVLAEAPPCELVLGAIGRFWKLSGNRPLPLASADAFRSFARPGWAKAALNFSLHVARSGVVVVRTETRVYLPDRDARRRFRFYWRVISPGSALIRHLWLRGIKRRAEAARSGERGER